jgi:hypothetical protein
MTTTTTERLFTGRTEAEAVHALEAWAKRRGVEMPAYRVEVKTWEVRVWVRGDV